HTHTTGWKRAYIACRKKSLSLSKKKKKQVCENLAASFDCATDQGQSYYHLTISEV
ncbi:hypothetical protein BgiMline_022636, partial [Biomphalaria glabrata]